MIAETSGDAVVYKYVRGAGLLYAENATDEKTWYVKDAHGDTVQLTDSNKAVLSNTKTNTDRLCRILGRPVCNKLISNPKEAKICYAYN